MKMKLILAVAAASALLLSSCRKADEVTSTDAQLDELEFTATIDGPSTKTTVNTDGNDKTNRGKIEWVEGDEIKIKDGKGTEVIYVASNSGTTSTFRKKSGQSVRLGSGSYTATYGTAPSTTQNYADHYKDATHAQNVYMTAESKTRSLTFKAACGLLKLTLTAKGNVEESIKEIEVSGTPDGKTESTTYTLTCDQAVPIVSATDFYLTLPAGAYTKMVFYNKEGKSCEKQCENKDGNDSSMEIVNNKIQPVTINDVTFETEPVFSVSADKQVKFTSGNLWWGTKEGESSATWHLEESQTAYPTSWDTGHVGHFFWTNLTDYQSGTASYMPYASSYSYSAQSTSDKFWCGEDNKLTVDGTEGLYALTKDEWSYLISTRTNASSLRKYGVTVSNGGTEYANCLIIAPDDFTGTLASSYTLEDVNNSGLVCLPAAGYRYGSGLGNGGFVGYYWSATPSGSYESRAYYLYFDGSYVNPVDYDYRRYGHSVRLVSSVSK